VKSRSATPSRLPDFVEPMKAKLVASMPSGGGWVYEIKFDGYRTLANAGAAESEENAAATTKFVTNFLKSQR
jgi:bifunctional non-homologous end joining protein LigD